MPQNTFTMHAQKRGRMKYLIITMYIPLLFMLLSSHLIDLGIIPKTRLYFWICWAAVMILGYFLIMKKNHRIDIKDSTIIETNWLQKEERRINASQIMGLRRNLLKEIILLDEDGSELLCVEANMSNFDQFQQWLTRHNIH